MDYSQDKADKVCELIMDGYSLRKVEAIEGMPRRLTILKWLRENPNFQTQYAHAREEQAEYLADNILEVADDSSLPSDDRRVKIDARKWIASKLKPKKYGDSTQIKHADANGDKLSLSELLGSIDGRTASLPSD